MALVPLTMGPTPIAAQQGALLRGLVAEEETGQLVPAATVTLVGTGIETRSTENGTFEFPEAPLGRVFVRVRAEGFPAVVEVIEIAAGGEFFIPIFLPSAVAVLDDILVITTRDEVVVKGGAMTAADLLALQVPGLSVFTMGGRSFPTDITLRGRGTFTSSGDPIVVLDGARITGDAGHAMDRLRQIPAGDIKYIRIQKGPSSAAFLYGSPNGVIFVQTHAGPPIPEG